MAKSFELIASSTVGAGGTATVTFSSIPSTYTDLCVVYSARQDTGDLSAFTRFNSDSGANYNYKTLYGTGSAAGSGGGPGQSGLIGWQTSASGLTASSFGNTLMYIPNYAGSTQKSVSVDSVIENNATAGYQMMWSAIWTGTSAINNISFTAFSNLFIQYSSFYLYGIIKS
jgi:hypothetical protein